MRKSLIAVALAAAVVAPAAFAANQTDTSAIKTLSATKHLIRLADGKSFQLPVKWKSSGFKVGDKVKVTYAKQGKKLIASRVAHVS